MESGKYSGADQFLIIKDYFIPMRYLFSLLFLLAYGSTVAQQPPMLPRDAAIEAKIEKLLEQMSLDEKIGQMVELEIGMITYRDPRYVVEKLARMSEQELADTLRRFGLDKQHNAAQLALTTPEISKTGKS